MIKNKIMKTTILTIIIAITAFTTGAIFIPKTTVATELNREVIRTEVIRKEITEIRANIEYNNICIYFDDGTYLNASLNMFFFTETMQNESVTKTYDENNNLTYVHVFYNPNTTIF